MMEKDLLMTIEAKGDTALIGLLKDRKLVEYHAFSSTGTERMHSIVQGRVTEYAGGLQSAFVNLRMDQNGFLNDAPKPGTLLPVQIQQEGRGEKVYRVTDKYSLSGRSLVVTPFDQRISISSKIIDSRQRERFRKLGKQLPYRDQFGFIFRTQAVNYTDEEILQEAKTLSEDCLKIKMMSHTATLGTILYEAPDPILRYISSQSPDRIEKIVCDDKTLFQRISETFPQIRIEFFEEGRWSIREFYRMHTALSEAIKKNVQLPGGGELVIEQTEAAVMIDVNSGSTQGPDQEDTIFKTNLQAAVKIARQLRLRNLSGIILIDFIDMKKTKHRNDLLEALKKATADDPEKVIIYGYTQLNLLEMTRKRTSLPLSDWYPEYENPC